MKINVWFLLIAVIVTSSIVLMYAYTLRYRRNVTKRTSVDPTLRRIILTDLYTIIMDAAEQTQTQPFIIYGTLLGFVRNKDLICYDYDLDFGIQEYQYASIREKLKQNIEDYPDYYLDISEIAGYKSIEIIHRRTRVSADISAFSNSTPNKHTVSRSVPALYSKYYLKECKADLPIGWIYPLHEEEFLNRKVYIPNEPHKLLECYYGPNFMTPDTVCDNECKQCVKQR